MITCSAPHPPSPWLIGSTHGRYTTQLKVDHAKVSLTLSISLSLSAITSRQLGYITSLWSLNDRTLCLQVHETPIGEDGRGGCYRHISGAVYGWPVTVRGRRRAWGGRANYFWRLVLVQHLTIEKSVQAETIFACSTIKARSHQKIRLN
jgi:hypothetical protein